VCAGQVLGQTAVSDLGKAPQLFGHSKRVFAAGVKLACSVFLVRKIRI
jgi:hypothetical protein